MNINPEHLEYTVAIIPTVLIPLTMISVGISIIASFIAALFGVELKTEGPKRLLEVLLKPKVLLTALVFNLSVYALSKAYVYQSTKPRPLFWLEWNGEPKASEIKYEDAIINSYRAQVLNADSKVFKEPKLDWALQFKKGGFRPPTLSSGSLFVSSFDAKVYEVDAKEGKFIRHFNFGAPVSVEPNIHSNILYAGEGVHETHQARVYAYDLASSKLIKSFDTEGHIEAFAPIVEHKGKKYLLSSSGKGGMYALTLPDLELHWKARVGHIDSPPIVEDGVVYTNSGREKHDPKLFRAYAFALDLETGKTLWKKELPVSSWYQPVFYKESVCFVLGEVYFEMSYGGLECFDKKSGAYHFTLRMDGPVVALPLIVEEGIILSTGYGQICLWDKNTDQKKWCQDFSEGKRKLNYTNAAYDAQRGWLLLPINKGLFIINPKNGELIQKWEPQEKGVFPTYSSVLVDGDTWYIYSRSGKLAKYSF